MVTVRTSAQKNRLPRGQKGELPPDVATWLTRNEVADLLGISINTIANLERRDMLHPQRIIRSDPIGCERLTFIYDPREVAKIPRRDRLTNIRAPGETAARCFELLDAGKTVKQIIVELRETPEQIIALREKWLDTGGADLVISPEAKDVLQAHVGSFTNVAELVEIVLTLTPTTPVPG